MEELKEGGVEEGKKRCGDKYLLKPLHDFLEGGLQLLGHCPFHGCQLGQRAVLLHARKHCSDILQLRRPVESPECALTELRTTALYQSYPNTELHSATQV